MLRPSLVALIANAALACVAFAQPANAQTRAAMSFNPAAIEDLGRPDGSLRLRIALSGSLQNPSWSPDGKTILFTRFRDGYNQGRADLYLFNLADNTLIALVEDGHSNITQPGTAWNARTNRIVFSSTRDRHHDEIYSMAPNASRPDVAQLTSRDATKAYEPSVAPDGRAVVFESHARSDERGRITMLRLDAPGRYLDLTAELDDCREPNWSPAGNLIAYQKRTNDQWEIWLYDVKAGTHRQLTTGDGDKTDATFSPDGRFVLFSGESDGDDDDIEGDNLFALSINGGRPVPVTHSTGYHGAASWSPDGAFVVLEVADEPPNGAKGTVLELTPVPSTILRRRR